MVLDGGQVALAAEVPGDAFGDRFELLVGDGATVELVAGQYLALLRPFGLEVINVTRRRPLLAST